jgi:hypothetical protein
MHFIQDATISFEDKATLTQFTLDHLQGIFYIYGIAVLTALLIFCLELAVFHIRKHFALVNH